MPSAKVDNPLRGHIVSFPKAIPSSAWMAQRILWADQIGAVWPDGSPSAHTAEDEQALKDAEKYAAAELFTACTLPEKTGPALMTQLNATLDLTDAEAIAWQEASGMTGSDGSGAKAAEPEDDLQFVYLDKFPPQVQDALLRSGVAEQTERGLVIPSRDRAMTLMCVLACNAEPHRDLKLSRTLDTDNPFALAKVAAPLKGGQSQPAAVLDLSVLAARGGGIHADKLVQFRKNDSDRGAREDYLRSVDDYLEGVLKQHPSVDPAKEAIAKLEGDLELARRSWLKRAKSAGLTEVALSTLSAVAPLSAAASFGEVVGLGAGVASAGLLTTTMVRKSHVRAYLNSARRAGLLA